MPEGIGYGAIKKKKPQKRNRLRQLSPKEIEKEFQGKGKRALRPKEKHANVSRNIQYG